MITKLLIYIHKNMELISNIFSLYLLVKVTSGVYSLFLQEYEIRPIHLPLATPTT